MKLPLYAMACPKWHADLLTPTCSGDRCLPYYPTSKTSPTVKPNRLSVTARMIPLIAS